jgi:hypothetical protein
MYVTYVMLFRNMNLLTQAQAHQQHCVSESSDLKSSIARVTLVQYRYCTLAILCAHVLLYVRITAPV